MDSSINSRTGKRVITVEGLEKSFEEKHLIREQDFTIFYQDSICLMGANGSGKTTLLKMILGEIQPDKGIIKLGAEVKIGYLPQNIVFEDEEKTLVEYFSYQHNITLGEARGTLAKMLFMQEDVNKKIKNLSGGEKSRLKLCSLTYEKVNLLILDEPTNHLDIESREALEEALMSFKGTLFFVSHDRYFIEKVADKILRIEEGLLQSYPFGYKDFLEKRKRKSEENRVLHQKPVEKENKKNPKTKRREANYSVVRTPMEIEKEIEELEEKQTGIFVEIEKNQTDYILLTSLLSEKEQLDEQIKALYVQWESLLDQNEEKNN